MEEKAKLNHLQEKKVQVVLDELERETRGVMKMDYTASTSSGTGDDSRGSGRLSAGGTGRLVHPNDSSGTGDESRTSARGGEGLQIHRQNPNDSTLSSTDKDSLTLTTTTENSTLYPLDSTNPEDTGDHISVMLHAVQRPFNPA